MPSDMVTVSVPEGPLTRPLGISLPVNEQKFEGKIFETVLNRIYASKQLYILVDSLATPDQIVDEINEFARVT